MVRLRGGGHRSPPGVVGKVRGVSAFLHKSSCAGRGGPATHKGLPPRQRPNPFPRPKQVPGRAVGEKDAYLRPPLAVVPQPRPQDHGCLPHNRLHAQKDLQLACAGRTTGGRVTRTRKRRCSRKCSSSWATALTASSSKQWSARRGRCTPRTRARLTNSSARLGSKTWKQSGTSTRSSAASQRSRSTALFRRESWCTSWPSSWLSWDKWSNREPGLFKLEKEGTRAIALGSKCYFVEDEADGQAKMSAKGVNKKQNELHWVRYERALEGYKDMGINRGFRTHQGAMYTYEQRKLGLSAHYDKRWVLEDGIHTEPIEFHTPN